MTGIPGGVLLFILGSDVPLQLITYFAIASFESPYLTFSTKVRVCDILNLAVINDSGRWMMVIHVSMLMFSFCSMPTTSRSVSRQPHGMPRHYLRQATVSVDYTYVLTQSTALQIRWMIEL